LPTTYPLSTHSLGSEHSPARPGRIEEVLE
jgi:hypothetical protein